MSVDTNAAEVAARLRRADAAMRAALAGRLDELAHRAAADLRRAAPKFRSTMASSVVAKQEAELLWFIGPTVDYAAAVEGGRKPGKGLPFWGTPQAASAMAWLRGQVSDAARRANPKWRKARSGSARQVLEERALHARYIAWSRAVKRQGIQPTPFVAPVAAQYRSLAPNALAEAVQRALRASLKGGAT